MKNHIFIILMCFCAYSIVAQNSFVLQSATGAPDTLKIYINPGHGGWDSDDRNVVVYPFSSGDTLGFFESKSNLKKGLYLRDLILQRGGKVIMSRVLNRSVDDRALSTIGAEATQNNCDIMISIHSNAATGSANFPLTLYKGKDNQPKIQGSDSVAIFHWENLKANKLTNWTYNHSPHNARGDWSFYGSEDYLGVLRNCFVTSFLSEDSFHDYIPETYRWLNDGYCKLHSWYFLASLTRFFKTGSEPNGIIAGTIKDKQRSFQSAFLPYTVNYVALGKDVYKPLNGVKVTLKNATGFEKTYTTDQLYNGVFVFENIAPGNYTLTYELDKYEKTETQITVKAGEVSYDECFMTLDRSNPLQVLRHSPAVQSTDSVSTRTRLRMYFNFELDRASFENAFSIQPAVAGKFEYSNLDRDVTFISDEPLASKTNYTVVIDKSAKHIGNVSMETDYTFSFMTKNKRFLKLLDFYPKDGLTDVHPNVQVRAIFDAPILSDGLNVKITTENQDGTPTQNEGILTNDYTNGLGAYFYRPKSLSANTQYTLKIADNIMDTDSLTIEKGATATFTIKAKTDVLADKVVDNFEVINRWKIDRATSKNIAEAGNQMVRYSTIAYAGTYSYRLLYKFTNLPDAHITARYSSPSIQVNNSKYLGMYVFGDLSYNDLSLIVTSGTDTLLLPVANLDYAGWKFKEVNFGNLAEGKTYTINGLRVNARTSLLQSAEGGVLVDNFAVYDASLTGMKGVFAENILRLNPNPAHESVEIFAPDFQGKIPCKVLSVNGKTVLSSELQFNNGVAKLSVSNLTTGVYIIQLQGKTLLQTKLFVE